MIRITFETKSINCIEALSRCYADFHASATQQPPAQQPPAQQPPAQQPPAQQPPAQQPVTPEQLNDAMVQATMKLNDNGSACVGILNSFGAKSISELNPVQLTQVMEKVRAL